MTRPNSSQDDHWQECPSGELSGLVERLHSRRRRRYVQQVSVGVVTFAIVMLAGVYAIPHFLLFEPSFGGIVCSEVEALADEYIAGRLDGGTSERINTHLEACRHCREIVAKLRQTTQTHRVLEDSGSGLAQNGKLPDWMLAKGSP